MKTESTPFNSMPRKGRLKALVGAAFGANLLCLYATSTSVADNQVLRGHVPVSGIPFAARGEPGAQAAAEFGN
jgi:hypothetical protein